MGSGARGDEARWAGLGHVLIRMTVVENFCPQTLYYVCEIRFCT